MNGRMNDSYLAKHQAFTIIHQRWSLVFLIMIACAQDRLTQTHSNHQSAKRTLTVWAHGLVAAETPRSHLAKPSHMMETDHPHVESSSPFYLNQRVLAQSHFSAILLIQRGRLEASWAFRGRYHVCCFPADLLMFLASLFWESFQAKWQVLTRLWICSGCRGLPNSRQVPHKEGQPRAPACQGGVGGWLPVRSFPLFVPVSLTFIYLSIFLIFLCLYLLRFP